MNATQNPFAELGRAALESTARASRISVDSAERALAVQLEYARGAIAQASLNARAVSQVKDVNDLMQLPARVAENLVDNFLGYSRSLYEVASAAQSEYSKLAEERMSRFQQAVTETVEQAARSAPAGSDVAVAAIKSQLAATTAAFDTFNKAAQQAAAYAEAGVKAASARRSK